MSTATATDYDKQQDERLKKLEDKVFSTDPGPLPPGACGPDPDPNDEHVREGGWGGDMASPELWESVPMKDDPSLYKVVDKAGKNIAHKFATEAEADKYIAYHKCIKEGGDPDEPEEPPGPAPGPGPGPVPPGPPPGPAPTGDTPYPIKGTPMTTSTTKGQRGPTERHYASGKPDDWTIERNVKPIPFKNYQFVVFVKMGPIEHDDNISVKFGGHHMGKKGWYDCGISFGPDANSQSQSCLGTEPKHPSTKLCIVKGTKFGSVLGKNTGVAGVYFTDENKIELWIKEEGKQWVKAAEGTNVGGLKPTPGSQEAQLRIDGFNYSGKKDETDPAKLVAGGAPEIFSAIVTEI
jgi:hypothetical protein